MIGKLLLFLLAVGLMVLYLRKQRQNRARAAQSSANSHKASSTMPTRAADSGDLQQFLSRARAADAATMTGNPQALAPRIKLVLWTVLVLLLAFGGAASYLHWQDQQRLVTVLLHRDTSQPPVIYRVAKRNLGSNSFTTDDGTLVTVSANERMEVVGL